MLVTHSFHQPPFCITSGHSQMSQPTATTESHGWAPVPIPSWISLDSSPSEPASLLHFATVRTQNAHVLLDHAQKHYERTLLLQSSYKAYSLAGAGAGSDTLTVASHRFPAPDQCQEFVYNVSKRQAAELSWAVPASLSVCHLPWATGRGEGKETCPLPISALGPTCLKLSNNQVALSCFSVCPQHDCCFTVGHGPKWKSPNLELNPPETT